MSKFDVRNKRVMVSLGPLTSSKFCAYSCPFCYMRSIDYGAFPSINITEIIKWIREVNEPYDIIYVSGDTDSFAPPRTQKGLELLEALCEFNVDILFTTRAIFNDNQLERLYRIQQACAKHKKLVFGCISISQLYHPYIEPEPIPLPQRRLEQLGRFKEIGLVSVLSMRPFLPVIPVKEYIELAGRAIGNVDVVLGSAWYIDKKGIIEQEVFGENISSHNVDFSETKMDFHDTDAIWKVFYGEDIAHQVGKFCSQNHIPFFMRSHPLLEWARNIYFQKFLPQSMSTAHHHSFTDVVFDLDGTLYSNRTSINKQIDDNVTWYIQKKLNIDYQSAKILSESYQKTYGLAVSGLKDNYNIDLKEFFSFTHDLDYEAQINYDPELDHLLGSILLRKSIFSNAPRVHVEKILARLCIRKHFAHIFNLESLYFKPKPLQESYDHVIQMLHCNPQSTIFIDDNLSNLYPASRMGMFTIWIDENAVEKPSEINQLASSIKEAINVIHNLTADS